MDYSQAYPEFTKLSDYQYCIKDETGWWNYSHIIIENFQGTWDFNWYGPESLNDKRQNYTVATYDTLEEALEDVRKTL